MATEMVNLAEAISFAARAHQNQFRKDGTTPYFAHPVRVAMTLAIVFEVKDVAILTAAVLHDTIEDTTTDFDDLAEHFGVEVATWVAALTKDSRLPEQERELAYLKQITTAGPEVLLCKLADIYDNLQDSKQMSPAQGRKTVVKATTYIDAIEAVATPPVTDACTVVRLVIRDVSLVIQG